MCEDVHGRRLALHPCRRAAPRSRKALLIADVELRLIAGASIIGGSLFHFANTFGDALDCLIEEKSDCTSESDLGHQDIR